MKNIIKKIKIGIKRNFKNFLLFTLITFSSIIGVIGSIVTILSTNSETKEFIIISKNRWFLMMFLFVLSIIIVVVKLYPKKIIKFRFSNTNTNIEILFGNLFTQNGDYVIPVDDFFETKIGDYVSEKSLHGKFLKKIEDNYSLINNAIKKISEDNLHNSIEITTVFGKKKKYKIGETIKITLNEHNYYCFAFVKNNKNNGGARTDISIMLNALNGLWKKIESEGKGREINIPLVGSGLSRIGLPENQIIHLILTSILYFTKKNDLNSTIRIVLPDNFDTISKIDLSLINSTYIK